MNEMRMNTEDLVDELALDLRPVRPLVEPGARARRWFVGAALYVALLAAAMGLANGYPDGAGALFWAAQAAAIVTSALASAAAFASVIPGVASRAHGFAAASLVAWLATLAAPSAGADWSGVAATHEWWCVAFVVVGGAPLLAVLAWMLRRGAPLVPATTAAFAALAVAALANVGACLSLPHPNNAVTFVWHGGAVAACTLLAAAGGRLLFTWRLTRADRVG
jgi:hypothetical protein